MRFERFKDPTRSRWAASHLDLGISMFTQISKSSSASSQAGPIRHSSRSIDPKSGFHFGSSPIERPWRDSDEQREQQKAEMARLSQRILSSLFLLLLLFIYSSLPYFVASSKKPPPAARKGDIPFIRCQVCEKIAHQIIHQVKKKEAQISPKKVVFSSSLSFRSFLLWYCCFRIRGGWSESDGFVWTNFVSD